MIDDAVRSGGRPLLVGLEVTDTEAPAFVLPTGTVTFLLTDVEGSSHRWEEATEAMAAAVPRHYAMLDEAIAAHEGVRPVEQGEGDSVVGAFSRASDAIAAALEAQRALASESWPDGAVLRVRMAVHTGEAQLRDESNYFGRAVIRCARLRAIGHGGQVLVSDATAGLVADRLPEGADLVDLGVHRLKDLGRPEHVWQLTHPDLPGAFPPLRSLDAFRHNLPVQLTPLIGRSGEIAEVGRLLAQERLVTLIGSGGIGKTRVALAVAGDVVERFSGGVWLVELAGVTDPAAIAGAALAALGAHQEPGATLVQQLALQLTEDPSLVVLDNCEHLVAGCADLVAELLAANPSVTVLATSREPLGVPGEVSWRVPSLNAPPAEIMLAVSALSQYDAVRLFLDRARRARPSFTVSDANAPAIAQICHRLDGIPLALELAAARCRQMSAERIARDLDDRFRLLTGGARTVLPRHQTLVASIDWSYDRLDDGEQIAFRRLGVFVGPFPLEAAEAVVAVASDLEAVGVFDILSRLVDKSLVVVEDGPDSEPRYRLLETLRAYALDRARTAGELALLRNAHAAWWLGWLDDRWPAIHTDAMVDQVEALHDNFQAALDWSLDDPAVGLRLLRRLARPWQNSGRPADAMAAVDRLLTDDNIEQYGPEWTAAANAVAVLVFTARGHSEGTALLRKSEQIATAIGDPYHLAIARWLSGFTEERAIALRDLARERRDDYVEALAAISVASVNIDADPAAAAAQLDSADVIAASSHSSYLRDFANRTRALAARGTGDLRRCVDLGSDLTRSRSTVMVDSAVNMLSAAALLSVDEAALSFAAETADRKLRKAPATAETADLARHRLGLLHGEPTRVERDLRPDSDAQLFAATLGLAAREAIDTGAAGLAVSAVRAQVRPTPHGHAVLAAIEAAAGDRDRWYDALQLAVDHGLRLIAVDALEGIAATAATSESFTECLRLCGAAQRLRRESGYQWRFSFEQEALDSALAGARHALGQDDTETAEAEGTLEWREAARYAMRARGERKRPRHGWAGLTPTEQQVVALVAEGLTNPQIAERLLMGRATVKTHLEHIFTKIGMHTRAELAAECARRQN